MSLGLDEQLNAGGLHGARGVGNEGSQVERLDVEAFEVVKNCRADIALAHAGLAADEHARAEYAQSLEGYRRASQRP